MSDRDKAASNLSFYMRGAWAAAGSNWQGDNDQEIDEIVDLIIAAARTELPALERQCGECSGIGFLALSGRSCGECDGTGCKITDAGRALIAFLQRHPPSLTRTEDPDAV